MNSKENEACVKETCVVLLIILAGLVLSTPLLLGGYPGLGDDGAIHGMWSRHFVSQWQQGEWYPRWLSAMNQGLGSPAFFFYAPLPYWATSLLSFRPVGDAMPWLEMGRSAALALVLSGLSCFLWLRSFAPRRAAFFASLIYMTLPYHLAVDLYARAAFGEFWAFVWVPLVLYSVAEIARRARRIESGLFVALLALSYGLLAMTHLPTMLLLSPVALTMLFWGITPNCENRPLSLLLVLAGLGLGVALAAVFLMPALGMQKFIGLRGLGNTINSYGDFFLTWRESRTPRDFLFATLLTLVVAAGGYWLAARHATSEQLRVCRFWLIVAGCAVFMMISPSRVIWQNLRVLQIIQFPWRFNIVLVPAATSLAALAFASLKNRKPATQYASWAALAVFFIGNAAITGNRIQQDYLEPLPWAVAAIEKIEKRQMADLREFHTIWLEDAAGIEKRQMADLREFHTIWLEDAAGLEASSPRASTRFPSVFLAGGGGETALRRSTPRDLLFEIRAARATQIVVRHFYFPGWQAEISQAQMRPTHFIPAVASTPVAVVPNNRTGLMTIAVPAGQWFVRLTLPPTPLEKTGRKWSLLALALIFSLAFFTTIKLLYQRANQPKSQRDKMAISPLEKI